MADKGQLVLEKLATATNDTPTVDKGALVLQKLQTGAMLGGASSSVNSIPSMQRPPAGIEQFAREGVPLDVTSGAEWTTRLGAAFRFSDASKRTYLGQAFNKATVDPVGDGNFIIRNVLDESTGGVKDLLFDEKGTTGKDVMDLMEAAPQVVMEIVTFKGLGIAKRVAGMGRLGRVATESAISAGASQTASAMIDAGVQLNDTGMINWGEIGSQRFKEGVSGFALGAAMGGGVESIAGAKDTLQGRVTGTLAPGTPERAGIQALREIGNDTGIAIQPTLGQMAHDPNVMRLESFVARIPFFGRPFQRAMEAQEEQVRALQRHLMGDAGVTPMTELGTEVADTVRAAVRQPQMTAEAAQTSVAMRAADEIESAIVGMAPSAIKLTPEPISDVVKYTARARHDEFRETANELFTVVGNPDIPTRHLDNFLKDVESKLPRTKVEVDPDATLDDIARDFEGEVEAYILDSRGKPVVTATGKPINKDLVPPSLTRLLRGLRNLEDAVPLDQLRTVRNTIDNAIREGRGLEDLSVKTLKDVSTALTRTIEAGANELADQGTAAALKRANAFYRENIEQFEVPVVSRLLKTQATQPGWQGGFGLMESLKDPDTFRAIEGFLKGSLREGGKAISQTGEKSFNLLRRGLLEDIYRRSSTSPGAGRYIDAKAFEADLSQFRPEIQATLLGAKEDVMRKNLTMLKDIKEGFEDVPLDDLNTFLKRPNNSVHDLSRLATSRKRERELFENEIVKKLLKGGDETIDLTARGPQADQAVDWLLHAKNEGDVTSFMSLMSDNPDVVEKLRANVVADFFQEVAQKSRASDAALRDSTHLVNPSKLIDALADPEKKRRLRIIIGDSNFRVIDNFAKAQTLLAKREGQTLPGTSTAMSILTDVTRLLTNVPDTVKFTIYSKIFTNRTLQRMVQEGSFNSATDVRALTTMLVGSPPVLEALGEEYGKSGAQLVIQSIKDALGTNEDVQTTPMP